MNKIFKTKRSRKFDAVVAVSEFTNNHQKINNVARKLYVVSKGLLVAFSGLIVICHANAAWLVSEKVSGGYVGADVRNKPSGVWLNPTDSSEIVTGSIDAADYSRILKEIKEKPSDVVIGVNARTEKGASSVVIGNGASVLRGSTQDKTVGAVVIGTKSFYSSNPYGIASQEYEGGAGCRGWFWSCCNCASSCLRQ